ncbi:3-ketosteroid 9alpha-monooxygenase subunit B [Rhodococcus sp. PvP016]|uniref:3-ketosteroid 9alpha-monooxygenase subunit B n=1 Tax=Rhodococcoides corynebacterioides TaxID=53972 RepID=A0ABS2KZL8_9NOCA|nr:3-ketosteroid 9alpha-monooxygenase subunit B [Rhodococcus corynebacterioides]MBP1115642.1 3-ketosteroid 9alpha-monooxygenase subunit B [Rhodococcus sp. PvP016]
MKITVKRVRDGYGSNWLCDNVEVGHSLKALPPSGVFTSRPTSRDFLLIAGGSGITPVMSIAKSALAAGDGDVVLFYANRNDSSVIFSNELNELAAKYPDRLTVVHWLESVQGIPTVTQLKNVLRLFSSYDAYVCGPAPFMAAALTALDQLGFPRERKHHERFISLESNPFDIEDALAEPDSPELSTEEITSAAAQSPPRTFRVQGQVAGAPFDHDDWAPDQMLLDFLLSKKLSAPFSCRAGECSSCMFRVVEGSVTMLHNDVLDDEDLDDGFRLACQSVPESEELTISYDF